MDVTINRRLTEELQQRSLRDYFRAVFLREHFLAFVVLCLMLIISLVAYFVDGSATPALIVGFIFVAGIVAWIIAYSSAVKAGKVELCLRGQGQHHFIVSERGITFHDDRGETTI